MNTEIKKIKTWYHRNKGRLIKIHVPAVERDYLDGMDAFLIAKKHHTTVLMMFDILKTCSSKYNEILNELNPTNIIWTENDTYFINKESDFDSNYFISKFQSLVTTAFASGIETKPNVLASEMRLANWHLRDQLTPGWRQDTRYKFYAPLPRKRLILSESCTDERHDQIVHMRYIGMSVLKIAQELEYERSLLQRYVDFHNIEKGPTFYQAVPYTDQIIAMALEGLKVSKIAKELNLIKAHVGKLLQFHNINMTNKVLLKREKAIIEASEKREVRRNKIKRLVDAVEKREEYEYTLPLEKNEEAIRLLVEQRTEIKEIAEMFSIPEKYVLKFCQQKDIKKIKEIPDKVIQIFEERAKGRTYKQLGIMFDMTTSNIGMIIKKYSNTIKKELETVERESLEDDTSKEET